MQCRVTKYFTFNAADNSINLNFIKKVHTFYNCYLKVVKQNYISTVYPSYLELELFNRTIRKLL